jgi:hypothetical protein
MYISPSQFSIGTSWKGPTNTFTVFVPGGGQTAALAFSPTVVWLFGGVTVFRSDDFTGDSSVYLGVLVNVEAGHITAFTATGFTIGDASLQVNTNGRTYYWAALHIPAGDPARAFFTTYRITGTAAAVDQVTDLGFTPVFATARIMVGGVSDWRGPWHTGLTSEAFNGGTVATQGLRAFGDGTIDLGTNVAVDGVDTYGWAMTDGEAIVLGDAQVDPPLDSPPSVEPPSSAPSPNCPVPAPEAEASGTACPTIL